MWFSYWLRKWKRSAPRASAHAFPLQRPTFPPRLEALEDRTLLSNYTASGVSDLIADIQAANKVGGTNTITLVSNTLFDLKLVNNSTNGANGLPVISGGGKRTAADNLTINGLGGDIIQRDPASGIPAFRLFDVASGGSLTLKNVTLQGGLASGSGAAADGGAIYNQGTLTLNGATVQGNTAQGGDGARGYVAAARHQGPKITSGQAGATAEGGGIWSNGTVNLENGTLIGSTTGSYPFYNGNGNKALGGNGGTIGPVLSFYGSTVASGGAGGSGFGGGLYVAGGSVTVSNATLAQNVAWGGGGGGAGVPGRFVTSGNGGAASGGGLYMASGTLVMKNNDTVKSNLAIGGNGGVYEYFHTDSAGTGGTGSGGGIYVGGGTVTLQAINLSSNMAWGGDGGDHTQDVLLTSGAFLAQLGLGGSGLGGGLFVGGGTVTLTGATVTYNWTEAGVSGPSVGDPTGSPGVAAGGGIYIASGATVSLDSSTVSNTTNNGAYNVSGLSIIPKEDDIDGSYNLI